MLQHFFFIQARIAFVKVEELLLFPFISRINERDEMKFYHHHHHRFASIFFSSVHIDDDLAVVTVARHSRCENLFPFALVQNYKLARE